MDAQARSISTLQAEGGCVVGWICCEAVACRGRMRGVVKLSVVQPGNERVVLYLKSVVRANGSWGAGSTTHSSRSNWRSVLVDAALRKVVMCVNEYGDRNILGM